MKNKIVSTLVLGTALSLTANAAVMDKGVQTLTFDYSRTSANSIWKGDNKINYFCANTGSGADCGNGIGQTTYTTYSLGHGIGLGWGLQLDTRVTYTVSVMDYGSHPAQAVGPVDAPQKDISEVSLRLTKNLISKEKHGTDVYLQYKHPGGNDEPQNPTFLAVNDYSSHLTLGVTETLNLVKNWTWIFDASYTKRSTADKLKAFDLPADQLNFRLDLPYQFSDRISAGAGLTYLHTTGGPDIGGSDWGAGNVLFSAAGHPPFYAVRERFVGYSMFGSYYIPKADAWVGLSRFRKLSGRNTDISRTWAVFLGMYL